MSFWLRNIGTNFDFSVTKTHFTIINRKIGNFAEYCWKLCIYAEPKGFLDSPHEVEVENDSAGYAQFEFSCKRPSRRRREKSCGLSPSFLFPFIKY